MAGFDGSDCGDSRCLSCDTSPATVGSAPAAMRGGHRLDVLGHVCRSAQGDVRSRRAYGLMVRGLRVRRGRRAHAETNWSAPRNPRGASTHDWIADECFVSGERHARGKGWSRGGPRVLPLPPYVCQLPASAWPHAATGAALAGPPVSPSPRPAAGARSDCQFGTRTPLRTHPSDDDDKKGGTATSRSGRPLRSPDQA